MKTMKTGVLALAAAVAAAVSGAELKTYVITSNVDNLPTMKQASQSLMQKSVRQQMIQNAQLSVMNAAANQGVSITSQLQTLGPISFAKMTARQVQALQNAGFVVEETSYKYLIDPIVNNSENLSDLNNSIMADTLPWGITKTRADQTWTDTTGSGVKVCIIDTGLDTDHPDLDANYVEGVSTAGEPTAEDVHGHGTHVAGTIAAEQNGSDVIGMAPDASLYIAAAFNSSGQASDESILNGLDWCVSKGVRAINMSYGGSQSTNAEEQAYQAAYDAGVLMVAATGNSGASTPISYPARYPTTMAVGSTTSSDNISSFSQRGPEIDVVAPGSSVLSDRNGGGTTTMSGTSMATPHVTGAAAAIFGVDGSLTHDQVRQILRDSAVDLGSSGFDNTYGYGRIDLRSAVDSMGGVFGPNADFSFAIDTNDPLTVYFTDSSTDSDGNVVSWSWDFGDGTTSTSQNPTHTYAANGSYSVSLTVTDNDGKTNTDTQSVSVSIPQGGELTKAVPVSNLDAAKGEEIHFYIDVPEGASDLNFDISGGTGDADLYVRFGAEPTTSSYDCRPYRNGNSENCNFATPQAGRYYVMLRAYTAFSGVQLVADYSEDGGPGGDPIDEPNLSDSQGGWKHYTIDVAAGASSLIANITGGSGDADLYVRFGAQPTTSSYDCRPYRWGNEETCTMNNPQAGTWYVSIRAYSSYSGVHLTANSQ